MTTRPVVALVAALGLAACAHAPKPSELVQFAKMREAKNYRVVKEKYPDLVKESADAYSNAVEAWRDEDIEIAKHWATLGTIKLRTALAMLGEESAHQRVATARRDHAALAKKRQELQAQLTETDEQLRLLAKLNAARRSAHEKEQQLKEKLSEAEKREEEQRRRAEAQRKISEAELALKMADTVEAATYASSEYATAQSLLARAVAALKEGTATDAAATAELARSKAEAALAGARPHYVAARQTAERQQRNQALQKDVAALAGVTVKMKAVGETQQLILLVPGLFHRSESKPRGDKVAVISAIGSLLHKYPDYPVVVNGYTSSRVRPREQYVVSQARAQEVANRLVAQKVAFKRIAVAGRGAESPIAAKRSPLNDRVEIILLFQ